MSTQKILFQYNRDAVRFPMLRNQGVLEFEQDWIQCRLNDVGGAIPPFSWVQFQQKFTELVEYEKDLDSSSADYVAEKMSIDEFRILVQEFAVDGLTEAQVFYYILPRLPLEAQMPMLRIMIDEFGSGNIRFAHTSLYVELLQELSMPTDYQFYIDHIADSSYEFVNLFYWLTLRADDPSYFCGALTYLETIIPMAFECYVQCCNRLNIQAHAYYSEHQHIDFYHAQDGMRILKALNAHQALDYKKAWQGVELASHITNQAFEGAVVKAQAGKLVTSVYEKERVSGAIS
ncbi:MAG: iron-containing redox enzyme family protein [Gammaproteobacteria bacterium]|nr:iron-containing redox enzyme family protein [Gammaproteobacteria bacterium]